MHDYIEPFGVTTKQLLTLIPSPKILKRALAACWIKPAVQGGKGKSSIYDYTDAKALWDKIKAGNQPPFLPCEVRANIKKSQNTKGGK